MNRYMHRLIVEDGKRGGGWHKSVGARYRRRDKQRLHRDWIDYDCDSRENNLRGGKVLGWDAKEFGDRLRPLRAWTRAQVGRKWDDVHSEFCAVYRGTSVESRHVYRHFVECVATKIVRDDEGRPCDADFTGYNAGFSPIQSWSHSYPQFYVDEDGILREAPVREDYYSRRKRLRKEAELKEIDLHGKHYSFRDGAWHLRRDVKVPCNDYHWTEDGKREWRWEKIIHEYDLLTGIELRRFFGACWHNGIEVYQS